MVPGVDAPARYRIGALDLAVVSDGYMRLDGGAVMGLVPRLLWEPVIGRENIDAEHRVRLDLNCLLVHAGAAVVLIETGLGTKLEGAARDRIYPGDSGHLLEQLASLGVAPGDVTHVCNTHLHADHCGGNTGRQGEALTPAFPNARYFVQAGEFEAAMHPNERTRGTYFAENFEPLTASGQLELVDGEREVVPGITFVPAPGHTADHAVIALTSGGETALYTGDLAHHAVQFERLAWIPAFDILPLVSLETKRRLVERAIRERALIISTHNAFPGAGRMEERDGRPRFVPA
jgi:glyoxylase-like metal-dependent hydrolase (beta-lactamase superfamily II)